ncbi:hypothetical protein [Thermogemmatispora tikiterensis]|uniref:Uncharacterized protein n=1 Tax=Thermogemmatispora tikiterensis TaxID=1825093 RepID=A0A328VDC9_9CHLR|nr:hypothetical protein [Thermogemmatispora tikiterensis]RAQ93962.1 hypothetical protein A4R35_00360 [Thermogemmatispora tikiterensis]
MCFICQKVQGDIALPGRFICQDELVQVMHLVPGPDGSVSLGEPMIEPLRHAPGLADLTSEEAQAFGLPRKMEELLRGEQNK